MNTVVIRHGGYSLSLSHALFEPRRMRLSRIAEDEPEKSALKYKGLFSPEIGKEVFGMQIEISFASESHVPRFRAGVGTWRSGYMIPIRLPWRHRARPSATLHEIQACPEGQTCPHKPPRRVWPRQRKFFQP